MGEVNFFHPVKTIPGNELDLTIIAGTKEIAMFKINNKTDEKWPPGSVMTNNLNGKKEKFELMAFESVYKEINIEVNKDHPSQEKEILYWFTDRMGSNSYGQAIILRLTIRNDRVVYSEAKMDLREGTRNTGRNFLASQRGSAVRGPSSDRYEVDHGTP